MIVTQFDTDPVLISIRDKHHAWHTPGGAHGFPGRAVPMGSPGSGHEFFQFHKDLMDEFFAWNNVHHAASSSDIAAWTAIPVELKVAETGWPNPGFGPNLANAEARINSNTPPFASDTLTDRLVKLESKVNQKRSPFIKPFMRPEVGEAITKRAKAMDKHQ